MDVDQNNFVTKPTTTMEAVSCTRRKAQQATRKGAIYQKAKEVRSCQVNYVIPQICPNPCKSVEML